MFFLNNTAYAIGQSDKSHLRVPMELEETYQRISRAVTIAEFKEEYGADILSPKEALEYLDDRRSNRILFLTGDTQGLGTEFIPKSKVNREEIKKGEKGIYDLLKLDKPYRGRSYVILLTHRAGGTLRDPSVDELLAQADRLLEEGEVVEARILTEQALSAYPDNLAAQSLLFEINYTHFFDDYLSGRYLHNKRSYLNRAIGELTDRYKDDYDGVTLSSLVLFYVTYYIEHNIVEKYWEQFFDNFKIAGIDNKELLVLLDEPGHDKRIKDIVNILKRRIKIEHAINIEELKMQLISSLDEMGLTEEKQKERAKWLAKKTKRNFNSIGARKDLERRELVRKFSEFVSFKDALIPDLDLFQIALTRRCIAGCRHCQLVQRGADGRLKGEARTRQLERFIEIAEEDERFRRIALVGGEIFDHDFAVEDTLFVLRNSKIPVSLQTNANFADSLEDADRVIGKIHEAASHKFGTEYANGEVAVAIQISMDMFHQEIISDKYGNLRQRIPVQNIANILQIVAEKYPQIGIQINCMFEPEYIQQRNELKLELKSRGYLLGEYDERESFAITNGEGDREIYDSLIKVVLLDLERKPISDHYFQIQMDFVNKIGWATLLRDFEYLRNYRLTPLFISGMSDIAFPPQAVAIADDGSVNLYSIFLDTWSVGNVNEEDLIDVLRLAKDDPLLNFLEGDAHGLLLLTLEVEPDFIEDVRSEPNPLSIIFKILESPSRRLYLTKLLIIDMLRREGKTDLLSELGLQEEDRNSLRAEYYQGILEEMKGLPGAEQYAVARLADIIMEEAERLSGGNSQQYGRSLNRILESVGVIGALATRNGIIIPDADWEEIAFKVQDRVTSTTGGNIPLAASGGTGRADDQIEAATQEKLAEMEEGLNRILKDREQSLSDRIRDKMIRFSMLPLISKATSWFLKNLGDNPSLFWRNLFILIKHPVKWLCKKFLLPIDVGDETKFEEAMEKIVNFAKDKQGKGMSVTLDNVGDAALSEEAAEEYKNFYIKIIDYLGGREDVSEINLSFKFSALCYEFAKITEDGEKDRKIATLKEAIVDILKAADSVKGKKVFIRIDMEEYAYRDITVDIFKEVIEENPDLAIDKEGDLRLGLVIQGYLRDSKGTLYELLDWAKEKGFRVPIRLVKGAYDEDEKEEADKHGYRSPVFDHKVSTDANYELLSEFLIVHRRYFLPVFATHNIRSMARVMALAEHHGIEKSELEFQMLFGMGDEIKQVIVGMGYGMREYVPSGTLARGLKYSGRRFAELCNKDNALTRTLKGDYSHLKEEPHFTEEAGLEMGNENTFAYRFALFLDHTNEKRVLIDYLKELVTSWFSHRESPSEETILIDVGAGDGTVTEALKETGFFSSVFALEPNPEHVARLREIGDVEVKEGRFEDAEDLPHADVIICSLVLPYIDTDKRDAFVQQMLERLKPKGRLVIVVNALEGEEGTFADFYSKVRPSDHVKQPNPMKITEWLEQRGYQVVSEKLMSEISTDDPETMLEILLFFAIQGAEHPDEELVRRLKEYRDQNLIVGSEYVMPADQVVLIATTFAGNKRRTQEMLSEVVLFDGNEVFSSLDSFRDAYLNKDERDIYIVVATTDAELESIKKELRAIGSNPEVEDLKVGVLRGPALKEYYEILGVTEADAIFGNFKIIRGEDIDTSQKNLREGVIQI